MKRLLMLALVTVALLVSVPSTASAKIPADLRVTAAVAAWKSQPVYVDPQYSVLVGDEVKSMIERIRQAEVPVYVAVVPGGDWFQEKGDTEMLAGWFAHANGKPGVYLVMNGDTTYGAEHLIRGYGPTYTYGSREESMTQQLSTYLNRVRLSDDEEPVAARVEPLPSRPVRTATPEPFSIGKAIGSGAGGVVIGLFGGGFLAGCVLGVAALVARRGGGQL